ncbi:MAG: T9SS type A sorting domain-containing protein [Ignavibacteria bacterium]|nr:T9SS type A sorting domain-containing protein [Ignavibacteria bacterium]
MKHSTKIMLIILCIIMFAFDLRAQFATGDVMIAVASGNTQWRKPDGTLVMTMNNLSGGYTTGMAFDENTNLYVTDFSSNTVTQYDNFGTRVGTFGSGYSTPESIVFDSSGNAIVGNLGNGLRKFNSAGVYQGSSFTGRVDFCDLMADQCTMLYTTEGTTIFSHDICTDTPLPNFATGLGGNAYALRIRPNGEVLVANGANVKRLSSTGTVLATYDVAGQDCWFALNLDPDNSSFWSADFCTANVYRIDIATGAVLTTFNTGTGGSTVFGLGVVGEITAATFLYIDLTPRTAINPINTQHCVTATVTDQNGVPKAGEMVDFKVVGVNGVLTGSILTNGSGQAQFCYIGANPGIDTIFGTIRSNSQQDTAFKTWDGAQPVELSAFTASVDKKDVTLNWSTSEELNNSGFYIERSLVNSNEWTQAGFVAGNGTTSEPVSYTFRDRNLASGKYNYRLKQIDFNGNYEYFNLSNEVEVGVPEAFTLSQNYPNPFNPSTKIGFDLPKDGNIKLYVYDNSGKQVSTIAEGFRTAGYYTVEFNASNLASGVYFYKLEYSTNGQTFDKVMKMSVVK